MCSTFCREFIEFSFTASFRRLPFGGEQLFVFESMKSGIERSLLDLQSLARNLLNSLRDGVAMDGAERSNPQDEEIESSLREIKFVFSLHALTFYIYMPICRRSRYEMGNTGTA